MGLQSYEWIKQVFQGSTYLAADGPDAPSFEGSLSCVQFFNYSLDPAIIPLKKYCQDLPSDDVSPACPSNYHFYDDWCYKVSEEPTEFAKAEMSCLPAKVSPYQKQLMYTENPKHWDYVAKLGTCGPCPDYIIVSKL